METYKFTKKQREAVDLILSGKSIFLTGGAGVGKSYVIKAFRELMGNSRNIAVTSTTGVSAILVGGSTVHSYLGIGLGTGTAEEIAEKIMHATKSRRRWQETDTLIIDEISMMSPDLFDKLEKIARLLRCGPEPMGKTKQPPFGGIQLILSGDFLQLPVVGSDYFCFESKSWEKCIDKVVVLDEIVRQEDKDFQDVLNKIRIGVVDKNVQTVLGERLGKKLENPNGIIPTKIFTINADVDYLNEQELDKLAQDGREFFEYKMEIKFNDFVKNREQAIDKYRKSSLAPETLQLCVGAQVMLLANLDVESGFGNGSRGVVVDFLQDFPVVRFMNGKEQVITYYVWDIKEDKKSVVSIKQIPLRVAYAITSHKSQGSTLDFAIVDLSNIFEYGQGYVAISRVKTLEGLSISRINYEKIIAHPKALEFYRKHS